MTSDGLMQIKDVRLEDAGRYRCMAKNLLGNDEQVTTLVVQSRSLINVANKWRVVVTKSILRYLPYHSLNNL